MSDLFLIAHKVRGEPAFDVAVRMACAECNGEGHLNNADDTSNDCHECECLGFWWIIPTSGHRAYPYHYWPWDELACDSHSLSGDDTNYVPIQFGEMPPSLPDHYNTTASPTRPPLTSLLPAPAPVRIQRRF